MILVLVNVVVYGWLSHHPDLHGTDLPPPLAGQASYSLKSRFRYLQANNECPCCVFEWAGVSFFSKTKQFNFFLTENL